MIKKLSNEFKKDDIFFNLQLNVRKNIQHYIDEYNLIFNSKNCDEIISTYFLIFWTNFRHIYGKNGEKNNTDIIKKNILEIIDGKKLPPEHKNN